MPWASLRPQVLHYASDYDLQQGWTTLAKIHKIA
jgi:hypothetical protein